MAGAAEEAPAAAGWSMPGPSMERLAQIMQEDPRLQDVMPIRAVKESVAAAGSCVEIIRRACEVKSGIFVIVDLSSLAFELQMLNTLPTTLPNIQGYAERTALTWCRRGSPTPDYTEKLTYRALWERVARLATALVAQRGVVRRGQFVAICGFASADWVVADMAGIYACCPVVPLPLNCPFEDVRFMLDETEAAVVCCALEEVPTILRVLAAGMGDGAAAGPAAHAKTLVVLDAGGTVAEGAAAVARVKAEHAALLEGAALTTVVSMEELVAGVSPGGIMPPGAPTGPDELLGLMYTSGSTGRPKGAMYTERLVSVLWSQGFSWSAGDIPTVVLGCVVVCNVQCAVVCIYR